MTIHATSWLRCFTGEATPEAPLLLICPHAGAGATAYRTLAMALVSELETYPATGDSPAEVVVAHYPGRQDRSSIPAPGSVLGYARGLLPETVERIRAAGIPRPITILGHSFGGLVAYELARLLRHQDLPVRLLVISATHPPQMTEEVPPHPTDDEGLLKHLAELEGTGAEVLHNQELLSVVLPALKADYAAFDRYRDDDSTAIDIPLLALGGWDDPGVTPAALRGWSARTTASVEVVMFAGDHFFINSTAGPIAARVAEEVDALCR